MPEESAAVKGSQITEEYSKRGRTKEQYKALRELDILNSFEVRMTKLSIFNARQQTASIW
jgi:hypothetical protein